MAKLSRATINEENIVRIRCYLDENMYSLVDFRLSLETPVSPTGFPKFDVIERLINRLDPVHRTLFRLFRLGAPVSAEEVERAVPRSILAALADTRLLVSGESGVWHTPNLVLVPIDGALVFVSIPASYPTVNQPRNVWFDLSSYVMAKALPRSFDGGAILDLCSGSGIQAILCAMRGADKVVGLEISEEAISLARLNAILNGVGGQTEFRQSDKLTALTPLERFDFILCNTPYAPVVDAKEQPLDLAKIGNAVLLEVIDDLPQHLLQDGRGIIAIWRSIGLAGNTYQRDFVSARFSAVGLSTSAFVDRAPDTIEGVLNILRADVEQRYGSMRGSAIVSQVSELLNKSVGDFDGFYNQLILFRKDVTDKSREPNVFGIDIGRARAEQ